MSRLLASVALRWFMSRLAVSGSFGALRVSGWGGMTEQTPAMVTGADAPEPVKELRDGAVYRHPVGRCQSVQCAACFDLIGPGPIERPGYCHHDLPRLDCSEGCNGV